MKRVQRMMVLLSAGACAAQACTSEQVPQNGNGPEVCAAGCNVTRVTRRDNTGNPESMGAAVEVAAWGSSAGVLNPSVDKRLRTLAAGAPTWVDGSGVAAGRVWALPVDESLGALAANATATFLTAPGGGVRELGRAIAAVDVREGRRELVLSGNVGLSTNVAWGEEFVVGAPGSYSGAGAVEWYESKGSHAAGWRHGGELRPSGAAPGDRFGASIAAPIPFDARYPDETSSRSPPWIAVGAPGRRSVYIFSVAPGQSSPLVQVQRIDGPAAAEGFGASISVADFNNDGLFDLAVGAPQALSGLGQTYVYTGRAGSAPIAPAAMLTLHAPAEIPPLVGGVIVVGREFGFALASGSFRRNDLSRPGLVVGAPGTLINGRSAAGAICQYQLAGATGAAMSVAWRRCDLNPSPGSNNRFGHALAVGNFQATSPSGSTTSGCARSEEIAVGVPGETLSTSAIAAGAVRILGQGANGGEPGSGGRVLRGTDYAEGYGRALAADYVQRSVHEDLVVGAPTADGARGSVSLTRAQAPGAVDDPISGSWRSTDSVGNPFDVSVRWDAVAGTLTVAMLNEARLVARRAGVTCTAFGSPMDFNGSLSFPTVPWARTATTHTQRVVVAVGSGLSVEAVLTFNASTRQFTLDLDNGAGALALLGSCAIGGDPFRFSRTAALTCE